MDILDGPKPWLSHSDRAYILDDLNRKTSLKRVLKEVLSKNGS